MVAFSIQNYVLENIELHLEIYYNVQNFPCQNLNIYNNDSAYEENVSPKKQF